MHTNSDTHTHTLLLPGRYLLQKVPFLHRAVELKAELLCCAGMAERDSNERTSEGSALVRLPGQSGNAASPRTPAGQSQRKSRDDIISKAKND